jgi:16S rRNA (cytosine967-C5)-methyltransferase
VRPEKPREIAANILAQRQKGSYIETILDGALARSSLKPEDRRFLQELVYGVVRWELPLDWLISRKTQGQPQKPFVQNLLRLALYQMFWLERVPSYAAVNETVEICKTNGLQLQAKFINAVLRGYGREMDETRKALEDLRKTRPWLACSHPEWLYRRWGKAWGQNRTTQLMDWNNQPPSTYARVNRLKIDAEQLAETWNKEGIVFQNASWDWVPANTIFRLQSHPSLATLRSFQEGLFYIQDPSTLLAPSLLGPQKGESILDLCAAPGGKTTFLAQLMQNEGRIVASDIDPARLKIVTENASRLGATCVTTGGPDSESEQFDRVLVDAPCSNTGVMRRRVELRWRIKPEEITRLAATQLQILQTAAKRTRPGGIMVYSTCSLEREENQQVVTGFFASNPDFRLESEKELTPMADGVDGAYCARLVRSSSI